MRLSRALHLRRAAEFQRVKNEGTSCPGKLMIMNVLPHPGPTRVGIITSRRVGNAVTRNRVRRRLREIVRLNYRRLATDFWMVLIARQAAAATSYGLLEQEWLRLAERTSILKA